MITCWRRNVIANSRTPRSDERDEDLGDRQAEVERDLAEHLQRDDHGCEMQPRVADRRQQDRVLRAPEAQRRAYGWRGRAHSALIVLRRVATRRPSTAGRRLPEGQSAIGQYWRQWPSLRPATTLSSPQLLAAAPNREAPHDFDVYLEEVRRHAYSITDQDVQALKDAGYSEDEIFEHTVSAAVAAGIERLNAGLETLR